MRPRFIRDERGVTAVEFALVAPVLIAMIIGVSQLGQLFFANAGIQHTVEQAARFAAIYPAPSIEEVEAKVHEARVGMRGTLVPVLAESDEGRVLDISLSYAVPLDFIFFEVPGVSLTHSRRVHRQLAPADPPEEETPPAEGSTGGTGGGTGDEPVTEPGNGGGNSNGGGNGNGGKNK